MKINTECNSLRQYTTFKGDFMRLDNVYCVKCGTLVSTHQAEQIFKTGFYKVTIPLAHCKECVQKEAQKINIAVDPKDYYEGLSAELPPLLCHG
jgi:transcription elongation factor Elf1